MDRCSAYTLKGKFSRCPNSSRPSKSPWRLFVMAAASMWVLASCGGGGGGAAPGPAPTPSVLITGTVASGTALSGTVSVYDSSSSAQPRLQNSAIGTAGAYSVNVGGFTAPFLLQATGQIGGQGTPVTLYSIGMGAGTVNITPITTLMVLNMAVGNFQSFMTGSSGGLARLTVANLTTQNANIDTLLSAVLPAVALSATYDFRTTAFTVGTNGYDTLLDNVAVNVASSAAVTITNVTAPTAAITIDTGSGSPNGAFDITNGPTTLPRGTLGNISVPAVTGLTQAAATTAITGANLILGTVTTASSATIASGNVISQSPGASTSVAPGSPVNIIVSSGAAQIAVPNLVGTTQTAATTSITAAGLTLGTVTLTSSATVAAGSVISQNPTAATMVASGSAVNLTVSSGAAVATAHFAYVTNESDNTISAYAIGANGTLTPTPGSPFATGQVPGPIQVSPSGQFLYVTNHQSNNISAYIIDQSTGALTAVAGSPFATGEGPGNLTFTRSGSFLYVANVNSQSLSAFAVDPATGILSAVAGSSFTTGIYPESPVVDPSGKYLVVMNSGVTPGLPVPTLSVFSINSSTGVLMPAGTPTAFPANNYLAVCGSFIYSFGTATVAGEIVTGFTVNSATGAVTAVSSASSPSFVTTSGNLAASPNGSFLFSPSYNSSLPDEINNSVTVFAVNATTGALMNVPGSPFAAGIYANSAAVDPTGQFLYVVNEQADEQSSIEDGNISAYTINATTGALTPIVGSPFAAGTTPVYIAIK